MATLLIFLPYINNKLAGHETMVDFVQKKGAKLQIPYPASQQYEIITDPTVANRNDELLGINMSIATTRISFIKMLLKNNKVVLH
ncbi:MAG: hypothetical protein NMNS01_20660 [Nitrosomonas sp.]|nr:MAG: hypothetical protein NMNS01_20660 [Nitrosomonas sp.]